MGPRLRVLAVLWVVAELAVFLLLVNAIGLAWTILAALGTSALGLLLLARQGTRALRDVQLRARTGEAPARALGDAGLVAVGGLLMVLPGFIGDLVGLLCLLPATRGLPRALIGRVLSVYVPVPLRGPVRVRSSRAAQMGGPTGAGASRAPSGPPTVIEGEVADTIEGEVADTIEGEVADTPGAGQPPLQVESRRLDG